MPLGSRGLSHSRWMVSTLLRLILKNLGASGTADTHTHKKIQERVSQECVKWNLSTLCQNKSSKRFVRSTNWFPGLSCVLTIFLSGEFHCVARWTLKATVGHNHEHLIIRVRHQVREKTVRCCHSGVKTFDLLLLIDHQVWSQTGLTPVIQLGIRRGQRVNRLSMQIKTKALKNTVLKSQIS